MKHARIFLAACALLLAPAAVADEAESRHEAIDAFYPAMIDALARGHFETARELCRLAVRWEPTVAQHPYNLACIEARSGNLDAAWRALEEAVRLGFDDAEHVASDDDLASLRSDPRFRDLVQRLSGRTAPVPPTVPAPPPAAAAPGGEPQAPAAARLGPDGPVGLFFMTRYLSGMGLEKAVWYFAPDGHVYQNLQEGFSKEDLAAHRGREGTRRMADGQMTVTFATGQPVTSPVEADQGKGPGFMWDMGIFTPVTPFEPGRSYAGTWEGGDSLVHDGNHVFASQVLELRGDGTFRLSGAASVGSTSGGSTVEGGSSGTISEGTWRAAGYSLTLAERGGKETRRIAFPFDDDSTPVNPDWIFFGGRMFKKN